MGNVSGPLATSLERPDKILPPMPMASLVMCIIFTIIQTIFLCLWCHVSCIQAVMENSRMADVKPRITEDLDKVKSWKLADIVDPNMLKALRLPDSSASGKVP